MSHEDSMFWLLEQHIQAVITIIGLNMKHDILDSEATHFFLTQKATDA